MVKSRLQPFHLAITVADLKAAESFYVEIFECTRGRRSERWLDLCFFGHQLVLHQASGDKVDCVNEVDGHGIPVPHFGVVLPMPEWHAWVQKLKDKGVAFSVPPHIRFAGKPGEQGTCFVCDPSGNHIEIKGFADMSHMMAT
jgi:hypothetical protein